VNPVESCFAGDLLGDGSKLVIMNEKISFMLVAQYTLPFNSSPKIGWISQPGLLDMTYFDQRVDL